MSGKEARAALTHLSLFSGIGGLDIAAEMAGMVTVGQCEWADYPTRVLERHWPDVPRWRDIRTLIGDDFYERTGLRTVDVVSGGFPCQPFSCAGKRRGTEDDRYLWPEMLRVIRELRPRWVVGENVAGIINMALDTVLADLEGEGYATGTLVLPACGVDAPHRRYRVAIVGYAQHDGLSAPAQPGGAAATGGDLAQRPEAAGEPPRAGVRGNGAALADAEGKQRNRGERHPEQTGRYGFADGGCIVPHANNGTPLWWKSCTGEAQGYGGGWADYGGRAQEYGSEERRATQPRLGGVVDGLSAWLDAGMSAPGYWLPDPAECGDVPRVASGIEHRAERLRCLGNAVVPQQFYPVFRAIADIEGGGGAE